MNLSKRKLSASILILFLEAALVIGENVIDKIWGDGDGIITSHHVHRILFTIELLIFYFLFFRLVNSLYAKFIRNKVSSGNTLQKLGKIFVIGLICTMCFLFLEISSRYFFPAEGTFDRMYPVENARKPFPYVMFKGTANTPIGFGSEVYNAHGYRGAYPKIPKDSGEFRIIVLGGSAVWEGAPAIPQLLEQEFNANGYSNYKVYNFGVVSSVSSMELITILNEVSSLSADAIILYSGANDITFPLKYDPRPGYPFNFLVYENNPLLMKKYPALTLLAYNSNLIRLFAKKYFAEKFSNINELKKTAGYKSDKWREAIADVYINNLKKEETICSDYHSRLFVFLQPMVYFKKNLSPDEANFIKEHKEDVEHYQLMKEIIMKKINPADTSTGFTFCNLTDAYDQDSGTVFRDDVHTMQDKKPLIAKEIFNELIRKR
jgi:hypothetical protein